MRVNADKRIKKITNNKSVSKNYKQKAGKNENVQYKISERFSLSKNF